MSGSGAAHPVALLVGAGGLGSACARGLVGAGLVRTVVICDPDDVEASNLHRQILHRSTDAGRAKADSAADAVRRATNGIAAIPVRGAFDDRSAAALLDGVDVVLDGTDNFAAKFLINDACVRAQVPFVHAAAIRWGGQVLAVDPRREGQGQPCYRCLFEAPPPPHPGASCREAGVVGPAVGVVGALQAEAALALLAGRDVGGRLVVYNGLAGTTRTVHFRKNPECTACGIASRRAALAQPPGHEVTAC